MRTQHPEDIIPNGSHVPFDTASEVAAPVPPSGDTRPETATIQKRALGGVLSLVGREAVIRLMSVFGAVALAWLLTPIEYGLFGIATFVIGIATLFSELGLGAAFIRRKEEVTDKELNAMFTLQLAFVSVLAAGLFLSAPAIAGLYNIAAVEWLIRALAINVIVTSLRSVPVVVAERNLNYRPIALADIVGQFSYWTVAISAAFLGFGVWSLVAAVLASGLSGTIALYSRTSWRPALELDWRPLMDNLRFGLLYQTQSLGSFVKDTMIPGLGGPIFGPTVVGYLTWAFQLTNVPMMLSRLVARVSYPALGKVRDDSPAFTTMLEAAIGWTCRLSLPLFAVIVGLAPQLIAYVFTPKWLPAETSIYLLTINMVLDIGAGIFVAALYSLGRGGFVVRTMLVWAGLTWSSALALISLGIGFEAIAAGYAIGTAIALPIMVFGLRGVGGVLLLRPAALPCVTGVAGAILLYFSRPWVVDVWSLFIVAGLSGVTMWAINLWPHRQTIFTAARGYLGGT
ncbi:MAG: oligosaccharide flippase family protein [Chloroflexota bacterium]|nr:oligosaccharide flippase family protein [Chloroflexota bacterium]